MVMASDSALREDSATPFQPGAASASAVFRRARSTSTRDDASARRLGLATLTFRVVLLAVAFPTLFALTVFAGMTSVREALSVGVLVAVAVLASARIASLWLQKRLATDLQLLSDVCRSIDGDRAHRESVVDTESGATLETRALLEDFESMAVRVEEAQDRLRDALAVGEELRAELEAMVGRREDEIRDRTAELQTANLNLERMVREDSLTGIANHRRFVEFAEQCWRICTREAQPVSILMVDVDHFKAFNDIYGHQAGDQCLRQVASTLASMSRRALDLSARYGGEEFAIVLGHVDVDDAVEMAEEARRSIEQLEIAHSGSPEQGRVTVSIGVATLVPHPETEVSTLISLADQALYRAKRLGRNRTERVPGAHGR